jgi:hypothetical protein
MTSENSLSMEPGKIQTRRDGSARPAILLHHKSRLWPVFLTSVFVWLSASAGFTAENLSAWVYPGPSGRLLSQPDAQGNHIIDNSGVGYMGGTVPLPVVPTVLTISPVAGDNTANIQNALNQLAGMPMTNGFHGALLLTAGYYAISNTFTIPDSGIVLRGVGNGTNGTVIFSTSTNGPGNGPLKSQVQGVVVISGSYSPIPISGTSNNIVDNYVPVGARSFTVDGQGVLSVGESVIIHRPSTANWITAIGMDSNYLSTPWQPGTVDVDEERVITRIEGNRVMIDQPITTALDQQYGGGSIYAFTWPQRFNNIGIENLRGQSTYDVNNTNDEDHAWTFLRFSNTQNLWVRNVVSQYFGKSCVSIQNGCKYGTVTDCQSLTPISLVEDERRYAFDINSCQLCIVENCYTMEDRHSFVTESLTDGPNVVVDGLAYHAYDKAGTHVMWASGLLFDNITTDNGIVCANNGNSGAAGDPGQGWTGANCAFWNCTCGAISNGFDIETPPTTHNWLVGGIGQLVSGGGSGIHTPGTYDSLGTNVFPNSLYYAQLQDLIAYPGLQAREYRIGAVKLFSSNNPVSLDTTWSNTVKIAAAGLPLDNFGVATNGHWVPFTFNFNLSSNEQIVAATLTISMLAATNNDTNDVLYLGNLTNSFLFSNLGWLPLSTVNTNPSVQVLDLGGQLGLLANGQLNVAVQNDAGVDWALLELKVAPILTTFTNALTPTADATVRAGAYATNNFGGLATLSVNEATLPINEQKAYLRWDLSGITGTILQARVQLVPVNVASSGIEQGAAFADTNVWDESTITWTNQPGGGNRFATWIPQQNVPVQFVIPPQMMDTVAMQSNQLCLQLYSIHNVGVLGEVDYASSEYPDPALRPQLFLVISNTAPMISGLTNLTIFQDSTAGPVTFNIGDAESSAGNLALTATATNTTLLPAQNIVFGGSGANPTLTLTPASGQTGSSTVSVVVTDPGGLTATNNFTLTCLPYTNASFVVSATPSTQNWNPAASYTYYSVNLTATNGSFTSNVVLSVSGLPVGATAIFSPTNLSGSGSSVFGVAISSNTPGGTYTLTITGTGGGLTRSTTVTFGVPGFLFSATPASQNVATNGSTSYYAGLAYTNGYNGNINLSVSGLPAGAAANFSPTAVSSSSNSTLTVAASPAMPPGIYPLTITATDGSFVQTAAVSLNVFTFSVSSIPGAQTMTTSAGINYDITVAGTAGVSNVVALSVSGLPANATASFLPAALVGSGKTTLSIGTALNTPPGNYTVTISGVSGGMTNSTTVGLTVTDFGIAATPAAATVVAGSGTNFTTMINAINGFADEVDFSVSGVPPGATAGFGPTFVDGSGTTTLSMATSTNTPAGNYVLTITGTDGTLTHSTNVTLKVAGFALVSSPTSRTVTSGGSASFTETITVTNGFNNSILLAVGGLPAGANASFSSSNFTGSAAVTLSVTTSNNTPAGVYPLAVTATSGNIELSAGPILKVQDFSLAATPAAQGVTAGVGTSYTVAVIDNNTFTGVVNLGLSGLPAGTSASFNPVSVTNTGTSTLSITTSNTAPGGTNNLTITGTWTGGSLVRNTNVTLSIIGLTNNFALNTLPAVLAVSPGSSNNYTATVGGSVGFTNTVALAVSGTPTGVHAYFNPGSITNGNGSALLTIIASNSVTPGIYTLTNIGTSGSLAQTNIVTLDIFSFTLGVSPTSSRTVVATGSTFYTLSATGTAGISNGVVLSVSGMPANTGVSYSADPMVVTNTGTSTLNVTTATNTPTGNYTFTVTGVFGTLTNTVMSALKVTDFTIGAAPVAQTIAGGTSTNYNVTITGINSFSDGITYTASGLPAGAGFVFNPSSFTKLVGTSSNAVLTLSTSATTPAGTNIITLNGISASTGLTHSTNVTLIVTVTNHAPVLSPVANQAINPGVTLTITNSATDSDIPAQTLTFNLVTAPTGAALNAGNGIFTWRPAVALANTTNLTTLKVTDSGSPPMSVTQSFSIVVNPLTRPTLTVLGMTNGVVSLHVAGTTGPDFTLQASSNLLNWSALFMTNSPALPFNWTDTNGAPGRFYRALLGP